LGSGSDGHQPHSGVLADKTGALYGTTAYGGKYNAGAVFKLVPEGSHYKEVYLYSFDGKRGTIPNGDLLADTSGALYGTATWGGNGSCDYGFSQYQGCGLVFKLTPHGKTYEESAVYQFQGDTDGAGPDGDLLADSSGALYGIAQYGGANEAGTVFKLTPHRNGYVESTIWTFGGAGDGASPGGLLIPDGPNTILGTTGFGGAYGRGTVFRLKL
jgi:uncharacterized repeat protein (TIGR03803 family)